MIVTGVTAAVGNVSLTGAGAVKRSRSGAIAAGSRGRQVRAMLSKTRPRPSAGALRAASPARPAARREEVRRRGA